MNKRMIAVFCAFVVAFCAVFIKTGAIACDKTILETANKQPLYTLSFGKTRGKIYDCNMVPLVQNNQEYLAACLPTKENKKAILENNAIQLENKAELLKAGNPFLATSTLPQTNIQDVIILPNVKRYATNQPAAHVIGYLSGDGVGITGIEKAYDGILSEGSRKSKVTYTLDPLGAKIPSEETKVDLAESLTQGVVLTIDLRIQRVIEKVGSAHLKKGAIVVMKPETGELLGVASFPSYNPYDVEGALKESENAPLLNRAMMQYSTGSVFKIVTAAAAIETGNAGFCHECVGYERVDGQVYRCHKLVGHGLLDLTGGIENSCNPFFIALGQKTGAQKIIEIAKKMSFGQKSLFAEGYFSAAGDLPSAQGMSSGALANISFGQGALTATPIQVARMVSCVVNGGYTPPATLVRGTTKQGKIVDSFEPTAAPVKAIQLETANQIKAMLVSTIMEQNGQNAKPVNVSAGGKTGTAQTGQFKADGTEKCHGWFAGFFPAENPQYVAVIFEEDSAGGNLSAAPIFKEIADAIYAPITLPEYLK